MQEKLKRSLICGLITVSCGVLGHACHHKPQSAPGAAASSSTQPATQAVLRPATTRSAGGTYANVKAGIRLDYPAAWAPRPSNDFELLLTPAREAVGERSISLDIPDLPPHVPGMIPMALVKKGYL